MRVELHEAIRALSQYLSSDTAYPFLVAANASSDLKELVRALPTRVHTVSMSDYCADDSLPDEDAVFNDLLNAGKPILLKGVGEQIMLSGNTTFLRRIAGQPFPQKIIVLCRNQGTELEHLQQQNTKFGSNRWCELCSSSDVSIVRVNTSVPIDSISGFKALLRKLEDHPAGKIYVKTEIPIICSGVISNLYAAIRDADTSFVVPERALGEQEWTEYLIDRSLETNDIYHWRSYLKLLLCGTQSPYFRLVIQHSMNYAAYRRELTHAILYVPHTSESYQLLYQERKAFLKAHPEVDISEFVRDSHEKGSNRVYYLTDNTILERRAILEETARYSLDQSILEGIYPDLAAYFNDYQFSCAEGKLLTQYFRDYKRQKANNTLDSVFLQQVIELSQPGNRRYNRLLTRNLLVDQAAGEGAGLYWIDALGVEYLGYIKKIAKELGLWIEISVGRASLPTLTEFNRDFFDNWMGFKCPKEQNLDKRKHEGVPSQQSTGPAIHLADELTVIRDSLVTIKSCLLNHDAEFFLLVSDHGSSRLCVLNQHENRWEINHWQMEENGKHSGRCCPQSDTDECPESATDNNGFWVLANYDRFKGGRRANVEVHGGASLEEVVVPVIRITLANEAVECHVWGTPCEEVATITKTLDGPTIMPVYCSKASANLVLKIKDKTYPATKSETNPLEFSVDLSTHHEVWSSSFTFEATAFDGDNELTTFRFKVQRTKRMTRNDRDGTDFFSN